MTEQVGKTHPLTVGPLTFNLADLNIRYQSLPPRAIDGTGISPLLSLIKTNYFDARSVQILFWNTEPSTSLCLAYTGSC